MQKKNSLRGGSAMVAGEEPEQEEMQASWDSAQRCGDS